MPRFSLLPLSQDWKKLHSNSSALKHNWWSQGIRENREQTSRKQSRTAWDHDKIVCTHSGSDAWGSWSDLPIHCHLGLVGLEDVEWRLKWLKEGVLAYMLFSLLWTECNPSVLHKWKVWGVQKVTRASLLGPLQSRECETAGDNHMLSKRSSKLSSLVR